MRNRWPTVFTTQIDLELEVTCDSWLPPEPDIGHLEWEAYDPRFYIDGVECKPENNEEMFLLVCTSLPIEDVNEALMENRTLKKTATFQYKIVEGMALCGREDVTLILMKLAPEGLAEAYRSAAKELEGAA